MQPATSGVEVVTALPRLAPRPAESNKGNFGRVLVVAGSRGMSGAAVLCGGAALRGGAGLVCVAMPEGVHTAVAASNPCYTTAPLPQDDDGRLAGRAEAPLLALVEANTVTALGPGLGRSPAVTALVSAVLARSSRPVVLDADGLNALQGHADRLRRGGPTVVTPHPGEFARLVGCDIPAVQARRQELAVRFAAEHGVVVVLKGPGTLVSDGRRVYRNATGNPGMATGGTGDVLTGVIASLVGQEIDPFDAVALGAWVHGRAGDLAAGVLGQTALTSHDLLQYLPAAFRELEERG